MANKSAGITNQADWLASLVNHSNDAIIAVAVDGRIVNWNPAAQRLFGYAADEILDKSFTVLAPLDRANEPYELMRQILAGQPVTQYETVRQRKDGTRIHVSITASAIRDAQGNICGASAIIRDITEHKNAQRRLRAEHAVTRTIADAKSLRSAAFPLLQTLCEGLEAQLGTLWMYDAQAQVLRCTLTVVATKPSAEIEHFVDATRKLTFSPGEGLPGRTWESKSPIWITKIAEDNQFLRCQIASKAELRSAMAFPILADDECIAVMDFFSTNQREPDTALQEMMATVGIQIGQFAKRRETEQAIRESEARNKAILTSSLDALVMMDTQGCICEFNAAAERVFGYQRDDVMGKQLAEVLIPPYLREAHARGLRRYLDTGESRILGQRVEMPALCADGSELPVELTINTVPLQGNEQIFVAQLRDLTDRIKAEEALRDSEERFRKLVESSSVGVILSDLHGGIHYANPAICRLLGYSREQFNKRLRWDKLTPPEFAPGDAKAVQQLRDRGWSDPFEKAYIAKDGTVVPVILGMSVLDKDENGEIIVAAYVTDMTDLKKTEQALRESEAREKARASELEAIVEAVPGIVWIAHDREGSYITGNRAAYELMRIRPGVNTSLSAPLDERPTHMHIMRDGAELPPKDLPIQRALRENRDARNEELQLVFDDGTSRYIYGNVTVLHDEQGQPRGAISAFMDITPRKLITEQLHTLNATLEQRVAIRTKEAEDRAAQLRAMAADLTQAEQRERRRLAQLLHDHLQQILVAAKLRLATMSIEPRPAVADEVEDLLNQAIEASRSLTVELAPPVLYDAGLAPALQWLGQWMKSKHGLEVDVHIADDSFEIRDDVRDMLFQAARELLFNVVKHAGISKARISLNFGKAVLSLCVEDQGKGFDPQRITKSGENGGFGLFSLRERIEAINSSFELDTSPGKGTRVTLTIPRHIAIPAEKPAISSASDSPIIAKPLPRTPAGHAVRVLLVDDHEIFRQGVAGLLSQEPNIEVVGEASDGYMAVELARELQPEVVVMDITLPQLTGIEATRQITKAQPGIRVIGMSIHEAADMEAAMLSAGAKAYLTKDGPAHRLIDAILGRNGASTAR